MTVGVPGSGVSYSQMLTSGPQTAFPRSGGSRKSVWPTAIGLLVLAAALTAVVVGVVP
jgi:hypothetical protein